MSLTICGTTRMAQITEPYPFDPLPAAHLIERSVLKTPRRRPECQPLDIVVDILSSEDRAWGARDAMPVQYQRTERGSAGGRTTARLDCDGGAGSTTRTGHLVEFYAAGAAASI